MDELASNGDGRNAALIVATRYRRAIARWAPRPRSPMRLPYSTGSVRASLVVFALLGSVPATASATRLVPASVPSAPAVTWTYLKASPENREPLAAYIEANWFAMDAKAVETGLFRRYRMLVNDQTDGEWDLVVEVTYNDACGYACVAERFDAIRAAHVEQRIDGRGLRELGRVLRTETVRPRD